MFLGRMGHTWDTNITRTVDKQSGNVTLTMPILAGSPENAAKIVKHFLKRVDEEPKVRELKEGLSQRIFASYNGMLRIEIIATIEPGAPNDGTYVAKEKAMEEFKSNERVMDGFLWTLWHDCASLIQYNEIRL